MSSNFISLAVGEEVITSTKQSKAISSSKVSAVVENAGPCAYKCPGGGAVEETPSEYDTNLLVCHQIWPRIIRINKTHAKNRFTVFVAAVLNARKSQRKKFYTE